MQNNLSEHEDVMEEEKLDDDDEDENNEHTMVTTSTTTPHNSSTTTLSTNNNYGDETLDLYDQDDDGDDEEDDDDSWDDLYNYESLADVLDEEEELVKVWKRIQNVFKHRKDALMDHVQNLSTNLKKQVDDRKLKLKKKKERFERELRRYVSFVK